MKKEMLINYINTDLAKKDIEFLCRFLRVLDKSPDLIKRIIETRLGIFLLHKFCNYYISHRSKYWLNKFR